ncbi:MAG: NAD-dependent epimerase/dehydratase family protein [Gemmatimonadales bacterium]
MKVLVTGAAGALGRLLVDRLGHDASVELVRTDRTGGAPGIVACDLPDAAAVSALLARARPDRIFHLAGSVSGDFEQDRAVNADAARFLCEVVRTLGLSSRIVVIGSAAEYGLVAPAENPISELRAIRPVTVYGLTKAFQTAIATYYAARYEVDIVVARLFNMLASGLGEHLFVGRAERLIARFRKGEITTLEFGNLSSTRDYVEAETALDQLLLIANKGVRGEVYHVASGQPILMRDLLARLLREAAIDPAVVRETPERPTHLGTDVPRIYADMTKTRALADA